MFRRQRILLLHLSGQVIRTTGDHCFYVTGQGWTGAADLPVGGQAVAVDAIIERAKKACFR